jgi:Big-like domain-containing protein
MRLYRYCQGYAARTFLIAVAIVGALLLVGGVAKAALPRSTLPATAAIAPAATTTTLTVAPVSQAVQGALVTLTAKVTTQTAAGAAPLAPAGTVQFKDGPDNLSTPVPVVLGPGTGTGTAVGTISQLTVGQHQLSAVFNPSDATVLATSPSQMVPFTVIASATGPAATRTSLTTPSPATVTQDTPVTLQATVSPPTAAGKVQFKDGPADLGGPATVSNGTASETTLIPTVGSHQLTAVFVPNDPAAFSTSPPSQSISLTVTASSQTTTSQAQQSGQSLDGPGPTLLDTHGLTVLNLDVGGSADGGGLTLLGNGGSTGGGLTLLGNGGSTGGGLTLLGNGGSTGGGLTLLSNGGSTGGGLTLLGGGGVADGRGMTVIDGRGLTVLRTEDNRRGGLLTNLLHALL